VTKSQTNLTELEEEIINSLLHYNLTKTEALILLKLFENNIASIGELAYITGLDRSQIYRILMRLKDMGIVEVILSKPLKFIPLSIKEVLRKLTLQQEERLKKIKEEEAFLLANLTKLHSLQVKDLKLPKFKIIYGRKKTVKTIKEIIQKVKNDLLTITTSNGLIRTVEYYEDDLKKLSKKGINLKWIGEITEENLEYAKRLSELGEIRHLKIPSQCRVTIADNEDILFSIAYDDSITMSTKREAVIWTNDYHMISLMKFLFLILWERSEVIKF